MLVSYSRDSLGVCATRGTSSISDSLLGIEAADVALLVVRALAAAIPSEDYWRFSDVGADALTTGAAAAVITLLPASSFLNPLT